MFFFRTILALAAMLVVGMTALPAIAQYSRYQIVPFSPDPTARVTPNALNNSNVVVGEVRTPAPEGQVGSVTSAFVWSAGEGLQLLPSAVPGRTGGSAYGISNNGLISGETIRMAEGYPNPVNAAASWINNLENQLTVPEGEFVYRQLRDVNDNGLFVGEVAVRGFNPTGNVSHYDTPVAWSASGDETLYQIPTGQFEGSVTGINNAGITAGSTVERIYTSISSWTTRPTATLWSSLGVRQDLPTTLPQFSSVSRSAADDINETSDTVGFIEAVVDTIDGPTRKIFATAWLAGDTTPTVIPASELLSADEASAPAFARGINDDRLVVGRVGGGFDTLGFIWSPEAGGILVDSLLIQRSSTWTIVQLYDINQQGVIIGTAIDSSGNRRGVLLEPVMFGDVNLDGEVSFLDISAFIAVLSNGGFQAQADCDDSGEVDFQDISPFIAILSGL